MELGRVGVWTTYRRIGADNAGAAAALAEQLGYRTFWLGGSPRLPAVRPLLEATGSLVVGTSIVNVWAYDPADLAAEYTALERDFPGRLMVGIGIGHPEATKEYRKPLTTMREFLDAVDGAPQPIPPVRRSLAALGPRMLELSAGRSLGALPYFVPVEHTADARRLLGAGPLLAPEVAMVVETEHERGRRLAREYAATYLRLTNYSSNLLRHGLTEDDVRNGGSDRLIDAVVPHGSAEDLAAVVQAHFDAGADHVAVQTIGESGIPRRGWAELALHCATG
jgi:probable F420-dependent oxidoreductase